MLRLTNCHVQPPGAAPKSTARIPALKRSPHWRLGINQCQASSSFKVERLGASFGNFKCKMPSGHLQALLVK